MSIKFQDNHNLESHYTATGFVRNKGGDKILFIFHNKLQLLLPPGGHVDLGELPHDAVVREIFEETGVRAQIIDPLGDLCLPAGSQEIQIPTPIAVLHEQIPAHGQKPAHLHYDFLYYLQADNENVVPAEAEVEAGHWFTLEEILVCNTTEGAKAICKKLLGGSPY
ncbi:MAG: NUDIX domain-containing protein [bacterium]